MTQTGSIRALWPLSALPAHTLRRLIEMESREAMEMAAAFGVWRR